ncbi:MULTISPECIES: ion transporter [Clostridium]|uniref:Cyclic nucleotide-gated potassium channel n=2 Tax=Clostridium TaxID=1485 RepID=A0A151AKA6_9CLOT|nr:MULTISPECIES: ion transporter [Clostridium]KYH28089.1 cyclic nucleotide-gated potassium channel [Clostridium colicanis DSM 13634]PRR71565.1 Cyclic nucleotide-gated potassium channel [Clostridium thermopalmarium DSM 5974]PVZ20970.1 voltage-gated potassium channel [Clostridium thermopalmarium DSM 5974]
MNLIDEKTKSKIYRIMFENDTPAGRAFDIGLIVAILGNSILIIAESVDTIRKSYGIWISTLEWVFVAAFTIEYVLRLLVVKNKFAYLLSFYGFIDLLAILPAYLSLFLPQMRILVIIRIFRLLRLFSILNMGSYIAESTRLLKALIESRIKIIVFLFSSLIIIVLVGAVMYIVEGPKNGFTSIPESMYWAIVTVSTVGYGDISPKTAMGKVISSLLIIIGYGILAVPTGIISSELTNASKRHRKGKVCPRCHHKSYSRNDKFCSKCGTAFRD